MLLLEAWRDLEKAQPRDKQELGEVTKMMPRKLKKRRMVMGDDGEEQGWEEYYDYQVGQPLTHSLARSLAGPLATDVPAYQLAWPGSNIADTHCTPTHASIHYSNTATTSRDGIIQRPHGTPTTSPPLSPPHNFHQFPDEEKAPVNLKILEMAHMWKKRKAEGDP